MKNGALVTAALDACTETIRLIRSDRLEDVELAGERVQSGIETDLWNACLADGWTIAELDTAFERRFAFRVQR